MKKIHPLNSRSAKNARVRLVAQGVIRDFAKNTGIHGIKYLYKRSLNSGPIVKLFWSAILVLAFLGSGLMLKVFWNRYQNNPMLTVVESFHVPSFLGTFPALTVCPIAPPSLEDRTNMLRLLRLPENMSRAEAESLLKYEDTERKWATSAEVVFGNVFELTHPRSELFDEHLRISELLRINRMDMIDFLKRLRGPCKDVVETCWWNENEKSCEKLFRISHSYDGLCCSFNYDLEDSVDPTRTRHSTEGLIPTAGYGSHSGLTLVFKGHQFVINDENGTISRITTNTVGLILYIHHSLQYPNSFNLILQAGKEMQLGIVAKNIEKVPGISRKSESPCASPDDVRIKYFSTYETTNCHNSCRMKAALSLCGCVPWQFAPFTKLEQTPVCGFEQLKCTRENYRKIWSPMYVNATGNVCVCPESCQGKEFIVKHTEISIASTRFTPSMIYRNISAKNAILRIFMAQQVFENLGSVKIANEIYMLSSVGGIFSLFLGCSILSIFEIAYFFLILIITWYSTSRNKFTKRTACPTVNTSTV